MIDVSYHVALKSFDCGILFYSNQMVMKRAKNFSTCTEKIGRFVLKHCGVCSAMLSIHLYSMTDQTIY